MIWKAFLHKTELYRKKKWKDSTTCRIIHLEDWIIHDFRQETAFELTLICILNRRHSEINIRIKTYNCKSVLKYYLECLPFKIHSESLHPRTWAVKELIHYLISLLKFYSYIYFIYLNNTTQVYTVIYSKMDPLIWTVGLNS